MREKNFVSITRGKIWRQVFGFSVAGLAALLIDLLVFNSLHWALRNPSLANLIAVATALLANFAVNFHTFRGSASDRASWQTIKRFSLVAGGSVFFIYALFEVFLLVAPESTGLVLTSVRIILIGGTSVARFFLYRRWVF